LIADRQAVPQTDPDRKSAEGQMNIETNKETCRFEREDKIEDKHSGTQARHRKTDASRQTNKGIDMCGKI